MERVFYPEDRDAAALELEIVVAFLTQFRAAPNLLTLLRLFIIPFLVIAILDGHFGAAFGLFLLAGISDGFDGLLARWLSQQTTLGLYLDPIADKLLLSTLFVVLTHVGLMPRYVTVLVFSRDLGILLISTLLFATSTLRDFRPSFFGKVNTVVQIVTLIAILAEHALPNAHFPIMVLVLVRSIALLAPLSAAQYAWIVLKRVNSAEEIKRAAVPGVSGPVVSGPVLPGSVVPGPVLSLAETPRPLERTGS